MRAPQSSQATRLIDLAEDLDLWSTPEGEVFATVPVADYFENWPMRSRTFKNFLASMFYDAENAAAGPEAINSAIQVLESRALRTGKQRTAPVRVARDDGDAFLYLDLADEVRHVIELSMSGWRLIRSHDCPVRFRRASIMRPLPVPERGCDLTELRELVNVASDDDFVLMVAWLLGTLRGNGPFPLLALHGEQGSGKTGAARTLRGIVDPSASPVRAEPRDPRDLMVATRGAHVLAFDNLSRVQPWLSDALCRLATGGGYATRALYTDGEEAVFDATLPVLLTGIEDLAERGDLMERSIVLNLPRIGERQRRTEASLRGAFDLAQPRILGALLDAAVEALQNERETKLARMPRMADFAHWIAAAELRLPWRPGSFLAAYERNVASANETALEASPVAAAVLRMMETCYRWQGTASELLAKLEALAQPRVRESHAWPKNAKSLSGHLKRLAPNLRAAPSAVGVEFGQTAGKGSRRWVRLTRDEGPDSCDASVASDAPPASHRDVCDASDATIREPEGGAAIEELF